MPVIEIPTDKFVKVATTPGEYYFEVSGGDAELTNAASQSRRNETRTVRANDRGTVRLSADESLYAKADSSGVTITVESNNFALQLFPRQRVEVEGDSGTISTTVVNSIETDNYQEGSGFDFSGSYPQTVSPSFTIQEIQLTVVSAEAELSITSTSGTTYALVIQSAATLNFTEVDEFDVNDPNNNTPRIAGAVVGE